MVFVFFTRILTGVSAYCYYGHRWFSTIGRPVAIAAMVGFSAQYEMCSTEITLKVVINYTTPYYLLSALAKVVLIQVTR